MLLVLAMIYCLRLGRSRIFAAPAAYSCCACFVAGEPGGGICVVAWADAPPVGGVEVRRGGAGGGKWCEKQPVTNLGLKAAR